MAVKIRLARRGRKKLAIYDVVVADVRAPRDGRFIEKIGNYNPNTNPATVIIDEDRAFHWVMVGAQPTDTVRAMLSYKGVMYRKHLQVGVEKGAITQEEADKKLAKWLEEKRAQIQKKVDSLAEAEATAARKRMDAEVKANEARIEKILKKSAALEAAAVAAVAADSEDSEEAVVGDTAEKAEVEEAVATEPKTAESTDAEASPEATVETETAEKPKVEATPEAVVETESAESTDAPAAPDTDKVAEVEAEEAPAAEEKKEVKAEAEVAEENVADETPAAEAVEEKAPEAEEETPAEDTEEAKKKK